MFTFAEIILLLFSGFQNSHHKIIISDISIIIDRETFMEMANSMFLAQGVQNDIKQVAITAKSKTI